jgi:uncharacterized protein
MLVLAGTLSLGLGILGIFIPGLPTTPFILLTASLYIRSSDILYQKLIENKIAGYYILKFHTNKGTTKKSKLFAIATMRFMIASSCIFFITPLSLKLLIIVIGVIGTVVMGWIIPTITISNNNKEL